MAEDEEPSLVEVVLSQKDDEDKFLILSKSIETILHYTERLETNDSSINEYMSYVHQTLNNILLGNEDIARRIGDMEGRFEKLVKIQIDLTQKTQGGGGGGGAGVDPGAERRILQEMSAIRTKVGDIEEKIRSSQSQITQLRRTGIVGASAGQVPAATPAGPASTAARAAPAAPVAPAARGRVVEEKLLKPSAFGAGGGAGAGPAGGGGMGGGMSVRSAMMSEIRSRMGGGGGGGGAPGGKPMGGGYMPRIHQPRAAKPLGGGVAKKMDKLLDSKFARTAPAGASSIKISKKAPPQTPSRGPPSGPPSGPRVGPAGPVDSGSPVDLGLDYSSKKHKKKDKKKDKGKKKERERGKSRDQDGSSIIDSMLSDKLG